jgi:hypothetical protein
MGTHERSIAAPQKSPRAARHRFGLRCADEYHPVRIQLQARNRRWLIVRHALCPLANDPSQTMFTSRECAT